MSANGEIRVRPAWHAGAELSDRARDLLIAEWRDLNLLSDDGAPEQVLRHVQARASGVATVRHVAEPSVVRLLNGADLTPEARARPRPKWPEWGGCLLTIGETAIIGKTPGGRLVRERFLPGSLVMPRSGRVLFNRGHERNRVIGHVEDVREHHGEVLAAGILVDSIRDGAEAWELARAGSVHGLSIEFLPLANGYTRTRGKDGDELIEHRRVLLVGLAVVGEPAYASARLMMLADRNGVAAEKERMRQRELGELRHLTRTTAKR